jgi:alpha-amylase/alpha-mannosidase (GH57 family)
LRAAVATLESNLSVTQPAERYICIHAHFYQPPRENPWLEAVELEDSAYPYHDWNERITAECYAPNSVSRILDGENQIIRLVNNYSKISFNFGPTLFSWLEANSPDVYAAILDADRESQKNFSGHGSALAQVYNHMILPLANTRDRRTQILWGIHDFERRFKRMPEGIWFAETAVDLESLEIVAELGIRFTILAPHQAQRVRAIGGRVWHNVTGARIDPTQAYEQRLPSGRKIALFFYDGQIARAVAFEGLLSSGENLANRLVSAFSDERERPQLVHIATDGESYGHHHRFGDMALAYALNTIESNQLAQLTNYGEYLERHPPTQQVDIIEKTSWSCFHGIDRWWRNCGCRSGGDPGWNQEWRTPLRNALDGLRDALTLPFDKRGGQLLKDPWVARDDYLSVLHDRSTANVERFLARHSVHPLTAAEMITVLKLLELQRHALLMYASCGWFFDELSGIETVQTLRFAGRAVQLGQELFGDSLESQFTERLAAAKSNLPEYKDGRRIYEQLVRPAMADWEQVGAHYAINSLFENYPEQTKMYCYRTERKDYQSFKAGLATFALGRVKLTSDITWESIVLDFGVIHMGNHHVNGGVQEFHGSETDPILIPDAVESFLRADFAEVIRFLDRCFGESNYSIQSLFRDEQRKVLEQILVTSLGEAESLYRQIYEQRAPMMRFLTHLHIPLPKTFHAAAELILDENLRRALEQEDIDPEQVNMLFETGRLEGVALDTATLEFAYRQNLERMAERVLTQPTLDALQRLDSAARLLPVLPFAVDLWSIQNRYYRLLNEVHPNIRRQMEQGDKAVQAWLDAFEALGEKLAVKVR